MRRRLRVNVRWHGLGDALLDIALSDEETHDLRSAAAYAVADLGSEAERERMRPLLTTSREIDPNDQLRGAALSAIYPADKYDDAMWGYLEHPRVVVVRRLLQQLFLLLCCPEVECAEFARRS